MKIAASFMVWVSSSDILAFVKTAGSKQHDGFNLSTHF